jgi:hypothetical protein
MDAPDASSVAALLREFGQRSALRGGNPFRTKAYARAADNLLALSLPLDEVIAQDRLREIPGIGLAIADIIKKVHATGTHPALKKMRKEIPAGVLEMLTIPGLRADKVLKLSGAWTHVAREAGGGRPRRAAPKDQGAGRVLANQNPARHRDAARGGGQKAYAPGRRTFERC